MGSLQCFGTGISEGTQHAFLVHAAFIKTRLYIRSLNGLDEYFNLILICISFYLNWTLWVWCQWRETGFICPTKQASHSSCLDSKTWRKGGLHREGQRVSSKQARSLIMLIWWVVETESCHIFLIFIRFFFPDIFFLSLLFLVSIFSLFSP